MGGICATDARGESIATIPLQTSSNGAVCCSGNLSGESVKRTSKTESEDFFETIGPDRLSIAETIRNLNVERKVDTEKLEEFRDRLDRNGVDTSRYGVGSAKPLELLYQEIYVDKHCSLVGGDGTGSLSRIVEQVQIMLVADIDAIEHVLVSTLQVMNDNRTRAVKQLLLLKMQNDEQWQDVLRIAFTKRLFLPPQVQEKLLKVDDSSYTYRTESQISKGYPGLSTQYGFHQLIVYVEDPMDPGLECIGLPNGRGFSTMEGQIGSADVSARLNVWAWEEATKLENEGIGIKTEDAGMVKKWSTASGRQALERQQLDLRVPMAEFLAPVKTTETEPCPLLVSLMSTQTLQKEAAVRAATRIREPDYHLRAFFDDCTAAFPELRLYMGDEAELCSGRPADDEYQRTIGALFSFYWIMRIDIDGKEGFCFGVDPWNETWQVSPVPQTPVASTKGFGDMTKNEKREHFFAAGPWQSFKELLIDSGILFESASGVIESNVERVEAMLALTAIHDIMKIQALLPVVAKRHAPFGGHQAGEKIGDHDLALAYVLEHFPKLTPSYQGLSAKSRNVVLFTQAKMEFNNGWLVQAEAPPGKLLRVFKQVIQEGQASAPDVAFYFVHWLTDLAGAVPVPLAGSEKFAVAFPPLVLHAFLKSFGVVKQLADRTETEVFEEYLRKRWRDEIDANVIALGTQAIEVVCKCRLLCMAQAAAIPILQAFECLPEGTKLLLSREMALTGLKGQTYQASTLTTDSVGGPAFLVYYGPALLQKGTTNAPEILLHMLATIFQAGRELWPLSRKQADESVILRIDTLKERSVDEVRKSMQTGEVWVLVKHNDREAFVERHPMQKLNDFNRTQKEYQVLTLVTQEQLVQAPPENETASQSLRSWSKARSGQPARGSAAGAGSSAVAARS